MEERECYINDYGEICDIENDYDDSDYSYDDDILEWPDNDEKEDDKYNKDDREIVTMMYVPFNDVENCDCYMDIDTANSLHEINYNEDKILKDCKKIYKTNRNENIVKEKILKYINTNYDLSSLKKYLVDDIVNNIFDRL